MPKATAPNVSKARKKKKAQSAGELDERFGLRTLKFPAASKTIGHGVAITPTGQIMVSATVEESGGSYYGLVRLDADGKPDPGFGHDGYLRGQFGNGLFSQAGQLIVDATGQILMCGVIGVKKEEVIEYQQVIARFLPDGSLDTRFGEDKNGWKAVNTRIPLLTGATGGRLILAKSTPQMAAPDKLLFVTSQKGSGLLTRFELDGVDDPLFAVNGWIALTLTGVAISLSGIIQLGNGLILVHGKTEITNQGLVMAFDHSGKVAEAFGDKGIVLLNLQKEGKPLESSVQHIIVQTAERLLLLGSAVEAFEGKKLAHAFISGFTGTGKEDETFNGKEPVITLTIDEKDLRRWTAGFALDDIAGKRIVTVGQRSDGERGLLTGGFLVDGAVDQSFKVDGAKDISWHAIDACLQLSSILVLGRRNNSAQLVRLLTAPAAKRRNTTGR
ncbi:delta-60 repeat domain-containing protein [Pseudomonas sp. AIG]